MTRRALLLLAATALGAACAPRPGPCVDDADCESGLCVHDLDRGDRYCSAACTLDADCPATQRCDLRRTGAPGDEDVIALCVERVRTCGQAEVCNGLDDDCDGERDEDCAVATCAADVHCGGLWTCMPSFELGALACREPLPGNAGWGAPCVDNPTCPNGLCDTGTCAPLCTEDAHCGAGQRCARPSTSTSDLAHQICHQACDSVTPCAAGQACTYRADVQGCRWRAVCSPVRGTLALGAACSDHDACASALCVGRICTRPCASGLDCQGLGMACQLVGLSPDPLRCDLAGLTVCQ